MTKIGLGILFLANVFLIFHKVSGSLAKFNESCGIIENPLSNFISVADEEEIYPGKWPWLVAIYHSSIKDSETENLKFKCSGTLISNKHIITAAHCVKKYRHILPAKKIVVSLGKYNLRDNEFGSKILRISAIRRKFDLETLNFRKLPFITDCINFVILVLKHPVEYTDNIKPICLWSGPHGFKKLVGEKGIVVGWGGNHQLFDDEPREISASIVSKKKCSRAILPYKLNKSTFCAGGKYKSGPCIGDAGSSLVVQNRKSGRYHLRGILLKIFTHAPKSFCNLKKYAVYLDLAKYQEWIMGQISRDLYH